MEQEPNFKPLGVKNSTGNSAVQDLFLTSNGVISQIGEKNQKEKTFTPEIDFFLSPTGQEKKVCCRITLSFILQVKGKPGSMQILSTENYSSLEEPQILTALCNKQILSTYSAKHCTMQLALLVK